MTMVTVMTVFAGVFLACVLGFNKAPRWERLQEELPQRPSPLQC
jgi:hypothetical protein